MKPITRVRMTRVNELIIEPGGISIEFVKRKIVIESNDFDTNIAWTGLFEAITDTVKRQENNP